MKDLFDSLDSAIESDNTEAIQSVLGSIVSIAKENPIFSSIGEMKKVLDDPDKIIEI